MTAGTLDLEPGVPCRCGIRRTAHLSDDCGPRARPITSCVACGEPTRSRWCSNACRRAEDGLSADEAPDVDPPEPEDPTPAPGQHASDGNYPEGWPDHG